MNLSKYRSRKVVLVDEEDRELGVAGLIEAHRGKGLRHRALSLFLYREVDELREWLVQKRAMVKPVFAGLWANTCCYNLAPREEYLSAAVKRVKEEMGAKIEGEILRVVGRFVYFADDKDGWCENEVDTVIVGKWSGVVESNPEEVQDWRWIEERGYRSGWRRSRRILRRGF